MAGKNKNRQRIEPSFSGILANNAGGKPASAVKKPAASSKRRSLKNTKSRSRKKIRKSQRGLIGFLKKATYWSFVLGIWGAIGIAGLIGYYGVKLPQSTNWQIPQRPPNARIVSVDGELVANRGVTGGEAMRLENMSPYIPMAVIAIEDRRFKSHFGIDPIGIARAMVTNVISGRLVQGGSTLTQQLAKNLFLEPKRNLERKVQEAILAVWLEHQYSKDEILELYLNRVYFGSGSYGVDAAARRYFSKSARDVNLAEAALLAGLLKAPSKLSPARNPKGAEDRAQIVLASMRRAGFVTDSEMTTALTMEAKRAKKYLSGANHYVADMVMKQLPALIGDMRDDIIIDTTIDIGLQQTAEELIRFTLLQNGEKLKVSQGALVSLDGTGALRALVGGMEYSESQFNRAVDAKRQPGSAFKPIVYLTALEAGRTPESVRIDKRIKVGKWEPENYDKKYRGPVTLSEALSKSLNTIAVQMVAEVGAKSVIETAARLGVKSKLERNTSIALGTSEVSLMELVSAYAPFANGGYLAEPFMIKRVRTQDGKVLYDRGGTNAPKVIDSREAGMMNQMLRRTVEEGTGKAAQINGWSVAGKTGTSQNFRDALFVGYTANLITGVWYGNDDNSPTKKVTGGSIPARTFSEFMQVAHQGVPVADLPGYYLPTDISVVPTRRPVGSIAQNQNGPTPKVGVGNSPKANKSKNILDMIFGG